MTTIDRLGILGIRSYGSENETFIRFFKPLTIILGRNGSGKSTVIEAVKMATTGDLPPNVGRGAAFIHDPRIDNETETKAKIRLMFTNIRGDQYIVARHFQLTIKPSTRAGVTTQKTEFKQVDQSLKRVDQNGVHTTATFRCNDLNDLLPEVMRVTKPVLNNVIFVHQEDSSWPLGDPKKVKDKFDEIFAATRYTKALDTIRKYRKDQQAELRVTNTELMHYEDKVRTLEKIRSEVEEIHVKYEKLRLGQEGIMQKINNKEAELNKIKKLTEQWKSKCADLKKFETEKALIDEDKKERYATIQMHLREESNEEIITQMKELDKAIGRAINERARREATISDLEHQLGVQTSEFKNRMERKGKAEHLLEQHSERLELLEEMKTKFFEDGGIFSNALTDIGKNTIKPTTSSSSDEWDNALKQMLRDAEENVKVVSQNGRKTEDAAIANVSNVRLRLENCRGEQRRKETENEKRNVEVLNIKRELRSNNTSESAIKEAESKVTSAEKALQSKLSSNSVKTHEAIITRNRREIIESRDRLESCRHTREQLVKDQSDQARLQFSRETVSTKTNNLKSLMDDLSAMLSSSCKVLSANDAENTDLPQLQRQIEQSMHNDDDDGYIDDDDDDIDIDDDVNIHAQEKSKKNNGDGIERKTKLLFDTSSKILAKRDTLLQSAEDEMLNLKGQLNAVSSQLVEAEKELENLKAEERLCDNEFSQAKEELSDTDTLLSELSSSEDESSFKIDFSVSHLVDMLKGIQISSSDQSKTLQKIHVDATETMVNNADDAKMKVNRKATHIETGGYLAESDLSEFNSDPRHRCPACGLSSTKREADMRKKLQKRVDFFKNPQNQQVAQNWKQTIESAITNTRNLYSKCCSALSLLEKSKTTSERLKEIELSKEKAQREFDASNNRLSTLQSKVGQGSNVDSIVSKRLELKQAVGDLEKAKRDLSQLQNKVALESGESKSLEEVDEEVRRLEDTIQRLQDETDRESRTLERSKDELRRCESRVQEAQNQRLELKALNEKIKRLKQEKESHSLFITTTKKEIEELRTEITQLQSDLRDQDDLLNTVRTENQYNLQTANTIASNRKFEIQAWNDCYHQINAFISTGLERAKMDIEAVKGLDEEIQKKSEDLKGHQRDLKAALDSQTGMDARMRNLRDNQRYRIQEQSSNVYARKMREVQNEITELLKECVGYNDPNAKLEQVNNEYNDLQSKFHATKGIKHVVKGNYDKKKKELDEQEKEGSRRKFNECRIKKRTMELASTDLDRYHKALDQALMTFHTLKMEAINRTIKELWQQTYRGTDIDEIEVTSDHNLDMKPSDSLNVARRNFNYRVVMRRGQAPLDMRGRCSSGQKVLACLVIRLALAESFCTDCGILALDEPTTNLDRMNIESLAAALRAIIESRKKQKTFQLVLITHDEEFIELLGARDFCSEYFKIFKDENQKSSAQIESLLEVGA